MDENRRLRFLTMALAGVAVIAGLALGGLIWIASDPEYWFPGAFAEEGPVGDQGPRGERGPRGPVGPPGDTGPGVDDAASTADEALAATDDIEVEVDDLASRVDNIEGVDVYDLDSRLSQVESDLRDVCFELDLFC